MAMERELKRLELDAEPEMVLHKLSEKFGVLGHIMMNKTGVPISTSMDEPTAIKLAGLMSELTIQSREFLNKKMFDKTDTELVNIRLRTAKYEIIVTPEENYTLIVLQDPTYTEPEPEKEEKQEEEDDDRGDGSKDDDADKDKS